MKYTIAHIQNKLSEYGDVYNDVVLKDANYPYISFKFNIASTNYLTQNGLLFVDLWGLNGGEILELADTLWKDLHNFSYSDVNTNVAWYRSVKNSLPDDNPKIKRIQLLFEIQYEEEN